MIDMPTINCPHCGEDIPAVETIGAHVCPLCRQTFTAYEEDAAPHIMRVRLPAN